MKIEKIGVKFDDPFTCHLESDTSYEMSDDCNGIREPLKRYKNYVKYFYKYLNSHPFPDEIRLLDSRLKYFESVMRIHIEKLPVIEEKIKNLNSDIVSIDMLIVLQFHHKYDSEIILKFIIQDFSNETHLTRSGLNGDDELSGFFVTENQSKLQLPTDEFEKDFFKYIEVVKEIQNILNQELVNDEFWSKLREMMRA